MSSSGVLYKGGRLHRCDTPAPLQRTSLNYFVIKCKKMGKDKKWPSSYYVPILIITLLLYCYFFFFYYIIYFLNYSILRTVLVSMLLLLLFFSFLFCSQRQVPVLYDTRFYLSVQQFPAIFRYIYYL